jgi:CRP-like cAMP-binding protein
MKKLIFDCKQLYQMAEHQPLINHISKRIDLTDTEMDEFVAHFKPAKIKKRQFIIQPEFIAKYRNYVVQGAFRGYVVGDEGEDHTIQFAVEDWWISDYNSYIHQQPATMFVVALEDSVILRIDHESERQLKQINHKFETLFRIMAERSTAYMQRRIITNLTKTAEERFHEFEEKYPLISNRVPQYALASYLGITTQYLSKLRNMRTSKKS